MNRYLQRLKLRILILGMSCFLWNPVSLMAQETVIPPDALPDTAGSVPEESAAGADAKVTLDYKEANLATVLRSLAHSYDLNLVATKDIQGKVTVTLKNVTIEEALEAVLSVNGYVFTKKGNLIYITQGPSIETIDQVTESVQLSYLTAPEMERLVTKMVSAKGNIQINESNNSLVVSDFLLNVEKIKTAIKDIDVPPIQVIIEAKIVDIQSKAYENLGTTTSITYDPANGGVFDRDTMADETITAATALAGPSSNLSGGQLAITTTLKDLTTTMTIDALIQQNKAHLLASPSIATLNGKEARIIIGEKFPYKEKTQTTTGTTETTKFIDVGTTLKVTPLVSPDGWITMNVHPEVSSVSASLDAGPRITTREADAMVRVRDGQTIIIGGLINKKDDRIKGGIPILGSIPVLGLLFSKRSTDLEETELTVFITPRVLKTEEEMGLHKSLKDREVYLHLDGVGDINFMAKIFEHARNLERRDSIESANKTLGQRKEEMLNMYKMILTQFPHAQNADMAVFKKGRLYFDFFKDYEAAIETFEHLINNFPNSRYRHKASHYLHKAREATAQRQSRLITESSL